MTRSALTILSTALLLTLAACEGPPGEDGQDGASGQNGSDGEDGLLSADDVYWAETTQTISAWTGSSTYAWCDYGDIVIGGGWESTNTYPFETIYPYNDGPISSSGYEGWVSSIANYSEDDFDVTITAICVSID